MGGMANTFSTGSSSGTRLVASTVTVGQAASSDASNSRHAAPTCSQLSNTSSDYRSDRALTTGANALSPTAPVTPIPVAIAAGT